MTRSADRNNKDSSVNALLKNLKNTLFKVCAKSGRFVGIKPSAWWFFPLLGIPALLWFLIRVVPKPSRLNYPCQQVAAPIAGSFLVWLLGITGAAVAFRNARVHLGKKSYAIALGSLAIGACWLVFNVTMHSTNTSAATTAFVWPPTDDGANNPMGVARGVFPGRVVMIRDTAATSWNGDVGSTTNHWWDDKNTNQQLVTSMFSNMLKKYANTKTDAEAWDAMFKYFNSTHNRGMSGYKPGEKIVIKINCNRDQMDWDNEAHPNPAFIYALVSQLIDVVGVSGGDITIAEPSKSIGNPIYNKIRSNPNPEYKKVWFASKKLSGTVSQRIYAEPDTSSRLIFFMPDATGKFTIQKKYHLPKCYVEATYLINHAVLRAHRVFGVTLHGKNHFGSVYNTELSTYKPGALRADPSLKFGLHQFSLWDYPGSFNKLGQPHCHPIIHGHKDLGGKEMLFLMDGLYNSWNQETGISKWSSMGNDWCSSMFISQDPVAIQSVGTDLICNEPNLHKNSPCFTPDLDNSLRECALAHTPPSGFKYDPENNGNFIKQSQGVHEHWNNPTDKKYSRNLSATGTGIELIIMENKTPTVGTKSATQGAASGVVRIESAKFANGTMAVSYTLYEPGPVSIEVLDMRGRMIKRSSAIPQTPGNHTVNLAVKAGGAPHAANFMVVRLKTPNYQITKTAAGI